MLKEGDFAMTAHGSDEEVHTGQVVHVMLEGRLGIEGGEYSLEASSENPAVLIQLFEQEENGFWEATNLYTACMMSLMVPIDPLPQEAPDSEMGMAAYDASVGKSENPILPTDTYQGKEYDGCGCETCKELNVNCENCPVCQSEGMKSDCCPDLNKQAPCWDGYVQRGMKPGADGKPVPNCVPVTKSSSIFSGLGKDYTRSTTNVYRME
jgi:hypothetical protein